MLRRGKRERQIASFVRVEREGWGVRTRRFSAGASIVAPQHLELEDRFVGRHQQPGIDGGYTAQRGQGTLLRCRCPQMVRKYSRGNSFVDRTLNPNAIGVIFHGKGYRVPVINRFVLSFKVFLFHYVRVIVIVIAIVIQSIHHLGMIVRFCGCCFCACSRCDNAEAGVCLVFAADLRRSDQLLRELIHGGVLVGLARAEVLYTLFGFGNAMPRHPLMLLLCRHRSYSRYHSFLEAEPFPTPNPVVVDFCVLYTVM
mmetsp:Transcript_7259/g.21040  ORF Transcript_7259/g.21040 Transcript_7259/m.21040 type:complete len:255 (-) Transcript_7259:816-1580(-)